MGCQRLQWADETTFRVSSSERRLRIDPRFEVEHVVYFGHLWYRSSGTVCGRRLMVWLSLVARRSCIATEHGVELLGRRLWKVACRRHSGLQWRQLRGVCTRRRWRRGVVALGRGRRRVGILPGRRLPRRLLLGCVGAVLIAANLLLLLLLLLRSGEIRGGGGGVHWGIPRSGPRGNVVGIGRQVL